MRGKSLLIGCLVLFLGACSNKGASHAPPPLDKGLLTGKWKNSSPLAFLSGIDFDGDGTIKVTIYGMKAPMSGKYSWSGERTLELKYPEDADVKKAYAEAAKAYKDSIDDRIQKKELDGKAGPSMKGVVPDQMPEKETYTAGISDPRLLVLVRQEGGAVNFDRVD